MYTDLRSIMYIDLLSKMYIDLRSKMFIDIRSKMYIDLRSKMFIDLRTKMYIDLRSKMYIDLRSKMYIGLHVKCPLFLSDFMKLKFSGRDFRKKHSNVTFHEHSSSWEPSCYMRTDGQAELTKLTVACSKLSERA